jgi:UDP-glucose 4-epimerase
MTATPVHTSQPMNHPPTHPLTGTGNGYSVLEMVAAMERASGRPIKYVIGERRPGDLDEVYSDPSKVRPSARSFWELHVCLLFVYICVGYGRR